VPADYRRWGIDAGYETAAGEWRNVPPDTLAAVARALGADGGHPPTAPFLSLRPGAALPGPWHLALEDGGELDGAEQLPPDVPFGYHRLTRPGGSRAGSGGSPGPGGSRGPSSGRGEAETLLVVSPGRCVLPDAARWGWAVQLYALRSRQSWGMGDLGDLSELAGWASRDGAGMILLNPLHAALPDLPQEPSPYFASSRCFRNPLYLRIEQVPGAADLPELDVIAAWGRALNASDRIDRDAVWRLKRAALQSLWRRFRDRGGDRAYERYCRDEGALLTSYASFSALTELLGRPWSTWPEDVRRPAGPGVAELQRAAPESVGFHQWLQWLIDRQLADAAERVPGVELLQDLAIGAGPQGADAWLWQDCLALDMRVGAPPDEFNTLGQDWAFPPFDPWRMRAAGYEPFRRIVRSGMRHAAGLRFDHVMGLFRLFWIPEGAGPDRGTYVRYPAGDLLDILALESHRAGAYVVGEDLGTVEKAARVELADRDILSYRVLWFESVPPGRYPERALAAVTTHDLPTVAGLWTGSDLRAQQKLDLSPNVEGTLAMRERLRDWTGLADDAPVTRVAEAAHELLAQAPSLLVAAGLDDALAVEQRPNMPGTIDEWPNWSIPLPEPLEEIEADPGVRAIAAQLHRLHDRT
jgi:4-alpha-glucanotransferase